jgi:hypothetical protein
MPIMSAVVTFEASADDLESFYLSDDAIEMSRSFSTTDICRLVHGGVTRAMAEKVQEVEIPEAMPPEAVELVGNRMMAYYPNETVRARRKGLRHLGDLALQRNDLVTVESVIDQLDRGEDKRSQWSAARLDRRLKRVQDSW